MAVPTEVQQLVVDTLRRLLHQYGPLAVLLVLFAVAYDRRTRKLWERLLQREQQEKERIIAERDKLQDIVLKERITSAPPPGTTPDGNGREVPNA